MSHRFFVPGIDARRGEIALTGDQGRHLVRVLRLRPGATVGVFDGRGAEWTATVLETGRDEARLQIGELRAAAPEPRVPVVLAVAVLKGDKMDDVVRDAVMMGVAGIRPVVTTRSETTVASLVRGRRAERWRRIAVASAQQSGRAVVPPIAEPQALEAVASERGGATRLVLVEPSADGVEPVPATAVPGPVSAELFVGPEGGWTPEELAWARTAGATFVRLGGLTLRAERAPLIAMAALLASWKDL